MLLKYILVGEFYGKHSYNGVIIFGLLMFIFGLSTVPWTSIIGFFIMLYGAYLYLVANSQIKKQKEKYKWHSDLIEQRSKQEPIKILNERLARGEITKKYRELKNEIENNNIETKST